MEEKNKAISLTEVKPDTEPSSKPKKHHYRISKKEEWCSGIKVLESVDIIIPVKLLHVCNYIANKVKGDEFSILTNILEKDDNTITLSDEFYIPKQKVSTSSIDYLPDPEASLFNTVIHRHPNDLNNFSATDKNYINQNFQLSLLYTKEDGFVNGIYNLNHNDYLIQLQVEVYIDNGIEDIDISNIEQEQFSLTFNRHNKKKVTRDDDRWCTDKSEEFFPEEKMDYGLMKDILLEDVNTQLQDIDQRVSVIEDTMIYGRSQMYGDTPF